jgi:hypothetical protein
MPMTVFDVSSDGINAWDQIGYNASGTLIFVWLDPLMHSFCDNFNTTEKNFTHDNLNNDDVNSGCEGYYKRLKERY